MTPLLDRTVLIGLLRHEHGHHAAVEERSAARRDAVATSPIAQPAFGRPAMQRGESAPVARDSPRSRTADPRHELWPDDRGYQQARLAGVVGHRQVTDAYLADLARRRGGRPATLDRGLPALHRDVADLIPTDGEGRPS